MIQRIQTIWLLLASAAAFSVLRFPFYYTPTPLALEINGSAGYSTLISLAFNALIDQGHSLIVVEHNTDIIKVADWVIDMGPEAGEGGGTIVYAGVPKGLAKSKASQTGKYLD